MYFKEENSVSVAQEKQVIIEKGKKLKAGDDVKVKFGKDLYTAELRAIGMYVICNQEHMHYMYIFVCVSVFNAVT